MAGQALGRFALQRLGQDSQDTQDTQDCAYLESKPASLSLARKPADVSLARKPALPPSWGSWVSCVSWPARQEMKSHAGGPLTSSGTPSPAAWRVYGTRASMGVFRLVTKTKL